MLPNEITLDVLHFLDYSSILRTKYACSNFLRVILRNQQLLASSQNFCLFVKQADVRIERTPFVVNPSAFEWRSVGSLDAPLAAAVVTAALNPITVVHVWRDAVATGAVDRVFSALPAAKYATQLCFHHIQGVSLSNTQFDALLQHFRELESVFLDDTSADFDWTILRSSSLLRLTEVLVGRPFTDNFAVFANEAAEAEIVRFVTDFSRRPSEPKLLSLHWIFSESFAVKIVQAVEASSGRVSVRCSPNLRFEDREVGGFDDLVSHPVLDLDASDYEYKVLNFMEHDGEGSIWANVAYVSRRNATAVFIRACNDVSVTNDPQEVAECQNPDREW